MADLHDLMKSGCIRLDTGSVLPYVSVTTQFLDG